MQTATVEKPCFGSRHFHNKNLGIFTIRIFAQVVSYSFSVQPIDQKATLT